MAEGMKLTPSEFREKWTRKMKAAGPDYERGVKAVEEAPGEAAAAKEDKMRQRLIEAIDNGKWARGVKAVTLDEWKSKTLAKGSRRLSEGADAASAKVERFAGYLGPAIASAKGKIAGMPDLTIEDNIARMGTFVRAMHENPYRK